MSRGHRCGREGENPDARTYSMSEVVAAIFGEDTGQSIA
jgi:hypothetical protein